MKLSAAQQKVLDQARKEFKEARECKTYDEYFQAHDKKYIRYTTSKELLEKDPELYQFYVECWKKRARGIVLTHASGPTIRKLEAMGLIKILKDATGTGSYTFDEVQVLNF